VFLLLTSLQVAAIAAEHQHQPTSDTLEISTARNLLFTCTSVLLTAFDQLTNIMDGRGQPVPYRPKQLHAAKCSRPAVITRPTRHQSPVDRQLIHITSSAKQAPHHAKACSCSSRATGPVRVFRTLAVMLRLCSTGVLALLCKHVLDH
jgi:hypothetical protein